MTNQLKFTSELCHFYIEKNRWPNVHCDDMNEKRLAIFHGMCKLKEFKYDKKILKEARRKLNESNLPWMNVSSLRSILCQEKRAKIANQILVFFLTYDRWPRVHLNIDQEEKLLGIHLAHMRIAEKRKKNGMYHIERYILNDFGIPWVDNSMNKITPELSECFCEMVNE